MKSWLCWRRLEFCHKLHHSYAFSRLLAQSDTALFIVLCQIHLVILFPFFPKFIGTWNKQFCFLTPYTWRFQERGFSEGNWVKFCMCTTCTTGNSQLFPSPFPIQHLQTSLLQSYFSQAVSWSVGAVTKAPLVFSRRDTYAHTHTSN